jgi:cellulose synthase operon protein C
MPINSDQENRIARPLADTAGQVRLFELPAERMTTFVAGLRRLGRHSVRICWLPSVEEGTGRVLVRVESPPALVVDRISEYGLAYSEYSPGVWVQVGLSGSHLVPQETPPGEMLLVRVNTTEAVSLGDFTPEIESLDLLPASSVQEARATAPRVETRMRLVPSADQDSARLWVLREDALGQLTAYCRVTHEQLLARFGVAVSATAGVPCVVLRALVGKGPPPLFVGPATAFAPLLRLPNVFLPVGMRLAPVLRRDALRRGLAVRPDRVQWLHPFGNGGFRLESLPDAAFHPLADWIDFRVPTAVAFGRPWAQSHRWEFEPFVEMAPKERKSRAPIPDVDTPTEPPPRPQLRERAIGWFRGIRRARRPIDEPLPEEPNIPVDEALRTALNQGDRLHHARPEAISAAVERCQSLEARFLQALPAQAADGPPDQWAELAAAYDAAGKHADAALCWLNALWGQSQPTTLWAWGWLRSESKAARPEVRVIDPGPWLTTPPSPGTTRAMAAWAVWAAVQSPPPPALADRGPELQARLEANEHWLPVRAAWLARSALARVGRGDVLGLARTCDRLSDRLLATGLSLELDTPSFLRFAGEGVRERFQEARRWLADRRDLIHQWLVHAPADTWVRSDPNDAAGPLRQVGLEPDVAHTRAYADLVLAWGLSRFAENATAETVRKQGIGALPTGDPVHVALRDGFDFRIAQVREGKPPGGPLPQPLLARINGLAGLPRYAIDKLREYSRVLEPTAHVGGYAETVFRKSQPASPADQVADLPTDRLNEELIRLLEVEAEKSGRPKLPGLMVAALERSAEWNETSVDPIFKLLPQALDATAGQPGTGARLIDRGLEAAARWDRAEAVRDLTGRFLRLSDEVRGWDVVETLTTPVVRALRRVGLQPYADRVLEHVALRVHRGQPLGRARSERPVDWPAGLRVLLQAAWGWYAAGRDEPAHSVLVEASRDLFAADTPSAQRTPLAFAYATALGQAPVRVALGRLEEMFQRLRGIQVTGSTNAYYALKPLMLVETAVRAVVSDEFALGPQVRSWLHADELAVRRRIRDDLKAVLATQGL